MKISEAIRSLNELQTRLGDVEVRCDYPCGPIKVTWPAMEIVHGNFDNGAESRDFALILGDPKIAGQSGADMRIKWRCFQG